VKTIKIFLFLVLVLTILQGCGSKGSSSSGPSNGSVRLVNATTITTFASLDMTMSGITLASAVAPGSASTNAAIAAGTDTFSLNLHGSGTSSAQQTLVISAGANYALVAHVTNGQLQLTALTEIEPAPAVGDGKIRVSNLALQDTGSVDVYLTADGNLTNATPLAPGYVEIAKRTYHITVTGAGNKADLRLDIPSVVISDQQIVTLVLTATTGGVLVDGWLVTQLGAVSAQINASVRVRVAANVEDAGVFGTVVATANGVSLEPSPLTSPDVGTYALVRAGALTIVVNGTSCNLANPNAAGGADLTLLVTGTSALPQCFVLNDDNRLPLGGRAKLRLVDGINNLVIGNNPDSNISLTADASLVAQNVVFGTASTATILATTGNVSQLQVNSPGNIALTHGQFGLTLLSQGVYSVFMLGDNAAFPNSEVGIVRADR
jgi:hypothetical protein